MLVQRHLWVLHAARGEVAEATGMSNLAVGVEKAPERNDSNRVAVRRQVILRTCGFIDHCGDGHRRDGQVGLNDAENRRIIGAPYVEMAPQGGEFGYLGEFAASLLATFLHFLRHRAPGSPPESVVCNIEQQSVDRSVDQPFSRRNVPESPVRESRPSQDAISASRWHRQFHWVNDAEDLTPNGRHSQLEVVFSSPHLVKRQSRFGPTIRPYLELRCESLG